MYIDHKELSTDRTKNLALWRYMDLWKFLQLIGSAKLYFPNIQLLGDQNEGKMPNVVYEYMKEHELQNGRNDSFIEAYREFFDSNTRKSGLVSS